MIIEISEKDVQVIEKMSMENILEMYSMTGAGIVIENGRPAKIDMGDIEETKNPIMIVIKEALEDAYASLAISNELIERLAGKLADEAVQVGSSNEERVEVVASVLREMDTPEDVLEMFTNKMSTLLGSDYCFDDPIEQTIEEEEALL